MRRRDTMLLPIDPRGDVRENDLATHWNPLCKLFCSLLRAWAPFWSRCNGRTFSPRSRSPRSR